MYNFIGYMYTCSHYFITRIDTYTKLKYMHEDIPILLP